MSQLPPWIRVRLTTQGRFANVHNGLRAASLHTVCENAACPNRHECFSRGTATVMILGDICTRRCRFCAVTSGAPRPVDADEPRQVAEWAKAMNLAHVVVTSVTRDDLDDGGARLFAETIRAIREQTSAAVEVLTPDFKGDPEALRLVFAARPDIFNHNLETVRRLQPLIRPRADYERSLCVLSEAAAWRPRLRVKSGLMVGLGETDDELFDALRDLRTAGCELLTLGQYLAPSRRHQPVHRFVEPSVFETYRKQALGLGFVAVASGPLVRSSYRAEELAAARV